jgi:phosphatidylserine synthase
VVFLVFAAICVVLLLVSYRRSGSLTRYEMYSGAPVMWVLLLVSSLISWGIDLAGNHSTAVETFAGGLIGTAFVQVYLMRRQARAAARGDDEPE